MRDGDVKNTSVDMIIVALCRDYFRREDALINKSVTKRTDTEYRYYNFKIFDATAEICGEKWAPVYIKEIGNKTGYAKSELTFYSEVTYKNYKRMIIDNIAKKLHLVDDI